MLVRLATSADLDAIVQLWQGLMDFHQNLDECFTLSADAVSNYQGYAADSIQDDRKQILVCADGDTVVGYVWAEIHEYPPVYQHKRHAEIVEISITKSARRQGVGQRLLDHALAWAKEQGVSRAGCEVAVQNPVSQGFWKKNEFRGYMERCVFELKV